MLMFTALCAGVTVYMVVLAALSYYFGEAPEELGRLMHRLQGVEKPRPRLFRWVEEGQLSRERWIVLTVLSAAVLGGVGLLLFRSLWLALLLTLAAPLYPYTMDRTLRRKRRALLNAQFALALQSMASSLRAGASLRTAVERTAMDLDRLLAGQPMKPMVTELERVLRDLQFGLSLEEALVHFRNRVQLEDVSDFVGAVLLCRVRGGNVAVVIASIAEIIEDKITIQQQIVTLTAGKRMEGNMITFAPPIMVGLLALMSPQYLAPLYTQLSGQIMLLVGIVCLVTSYFISRRLMEIDV